MGKTLILVDSVRAAREMLKSSELQGENTILSTHYAVVGFLSARGIPCKDFSDLMTVNQGRAAIYRASRELRDWCCRLDADLGKQICVASGLPTIGIFYRLFKYPWEYNLSGLILFKQILSSVLEQYAISRVCYFCDATLASHPLFSFLEAAHTLCRARGTVFLVRADYGPGRVRRKWRQLLLRMALAVSDPDKVIRRVHERLALRKVRSSLFSDTRPVAIVFEPAGEFALALSNRGSQIVVMPRAGVIEVEGVSLQSALAAVAKAQAVARAWLELAMQGNGDETLSTIVKYFTENTEALMLPAIYTSLVMQCRPVHVATWDSPLASDMGSNLALECLLASGVRVLGRQHGACYADQDMGEKHFDSDFNRCTHFLSYGITQDEFESTYPGVNARCKFLPAGRACVTPKQSARSVDIAFPITNCISLTSFGRMEREVAHRQELTLRALEARPDLICIVKPMLNYSEDNFSQTETLRRLRHVRIVRCTWIDLLRKYRPRLVVIEMISTPLYEVLHLDVDIFLMQCEIAPLSHSALCLLEKRVHIFSSSEEMADAIGRYGREPTPTLRDDEFLRKYANRGTFGSALDAAGM